jgi:hypothetical protein
MKGCSVEYADSNALALLLLLIATIELILL